MLSKPTVKGAFVEMVVVVASILIAFGLDAWWQDRMARVEEREILQALASEFEQIGEEIQIMEEYRSASMDLTLDFLEMTESGRVEIGEDSLDYLMVFLFNFVGQETFPTGVLTSVISSGQLSLIQNEQLRHELGGWPKEIAVLREILENERWEYREQFKPFMRLHADLPQIHRRWDGFDPATQMNFPVVEIAPRPTRVDHRPLLRNDEFRNQLLIKVWTFNNMEVQLDLFREKQQEILALIEEELAEGWHSQRNAFRALDRALRERRGIGGAP